MSLYRVSQKNFVNSPAPITLPNNATGVVINLYEGALKIEPPPPGTPGDVLPLTANKTVTFNQMDDNTVITSTHPDTAAVIYWIHPVYGPGDIGSPTSDPTSSPLAVFVAQPEVQAAVKTTVADGRVTWVFPRPFPVGVTPVISATPVDTNTTDGISANVDIESVSNTQVTVRLWKSQALLALLGLPTTPIGAGVPVHLIATTPS